MTVQSWGVHYQAGTAKLYCRLLELNSGHTQLLCCLIRTVFQVRTSVPELEQIIAEGIKQERREMKFLKDIYMTNFLQNLFKNKKFKFATAISCFEFGDSILLALGFLRGYFFLYWRWYFYVTCFWLLQAAGESEFVCKEQFWGLEDTGVTWSIITIQVYTLTQQLPAQTLPGILSYSLWNFHGLQFIAYF